MKKILIIANHEYTIYNFRLELLQKLLKDGNEVFISCPYGERIPYLEGLGCKFVQTKMNRHGKNPFGDLFLLAQYKKILKKIKPNIVLSFTIKPNIYGAIACRQQNIPIITNITGLGVGLEKKSLTQRIIIGLYKYSFKKVETVFFQNEENMEFFIKNKISSNESYELLPGSGVNLERYKYVEYPKNTDNIRFIFISRIMKEKGIELYLNAAKELKEKYNNLEFHVCGFCEEEYEDLLAEFHKKKIIQYHGMVDNIELMIEKMHCTVHPTYYPEGLSNVLLESSAIGRPIITTDRSGCREVVDNGKNGYLISENNQNELIEAIETFIKSSYEDKILMGENGRQHVEKNFDRDIVINKYIERIERKSVR